MYVPTTSHIGRLSSVYCDIFQAIFGVGLHITESGPSLLSVFSDAVWASNLDDHHNTSGHTIFFCGNLIPWSSRKHPTMSRSSTEAEYEEVANATVELIWIQVLLCELGIHQPRPPNLWCDNIGATYLTNNPIFYRRTKHVEVGYHFICECVALWQLEVEIISLKHLVTDQAVGRSDI
jgi:hypothetical protein